MATRDMMHDHYLAACLKCAPELHQYHNGLGYSSLYSDTLTWALLGPSWSPLGGLLGRLGSLLGRRRLTQSGQDQDEENEENEEEEAVLEA